MDEAETKRGGTSRVDQAGQGEAPAEGPAADDSKPTGQAGTGQSDRGEPAKAD